MKTVRLVLLCDVHQGSRPDLQALFAELRLTSQWRQSSQTLWLLNTEEPIDQLFERLASKTPQTVRLILADVGERVIGNLSHDDRVWLRRRLPACWLAAEPENKRVDEAAACA